MKKVSFSRFLRSLTAIVLALMLPFNAMASTLVVNSEAQEVSVQPRAVEADPVITLPAALKAVPAQAFMGNDAAEEVILPEGILSIGEQAFADCTALVRAVIPESVKSIAQDAFEDLQEQLGTELADMLHYIVAIAAINKIDLTDTVLQKDKAASVKYRRATNLETFIQNRK